jgi:hypothetical protein
VILELLFRSQVPFSALVYLLLDLTCSTKALRMFLFHMLNSLLILPDNTLVLLAPAMDAQVSCNWPCFIMEACNDGRGREALWHETELAMGKSDHLKRPPTTQTRIIFLSITLTYFGNSKGNVYVL